MTKSRGDDDYYDFGPLHPDGNHICAWERQHVSTGLLDQNGNQIMRGPRPIGFGCDLRRPYVLEWPH